MRKRSPYDFKQIQKSQQILDESNPFLVESLDAKTDEELQEYALEFERHYDLAMQSRNHNTRQHAIETRKTIFAMMEVRRLTDMLNRIENEDDDGHGGVVLS